MSPVGVVDVGAVVVGEVGDEDDGPALVGVAASWRARLTAAAASTMPAP
jgi:hypothetical protein